MPSIDILILPPLELPPSVNDAYTHRVGFKKGFSGVIRNYNDLLKHTYAQRIKTALAKSYCQRVSAFLNETGLTTQIREFVEACAFVDVELSLFKSNWIKSDGTASKTAGDADNRLKILQDCIFDTIGINDAEVFRVTSGKVPCSATHPYVNQVIVSLREHSTDYDYL